MKNHFGFTLAEVLITLSIIGIIAAMTIPTLMQNKENASIKAKVEKEYSTFANAVNRATVDNGPIESWTWTGGGEQAHGILDLLAPYMKISDRCEFHTVCDFWPSDYLYLSGPSSGFNFYGMATNEARARLADGSILAIGYGNLGSGNCSDPSSGDDICGQIYLDINGKSGPNKWGYDFFLFNIKKSGVVPYEDEGTCENLGNSGMECSKKIIVNNDISYMTTKAPQICYGAKGEVIPCP